MNPPHRNITQEMRDEGFQVPECFEDDQLFTWINPETNEPLTFNVSALARMWAQDRSIGELGLGAFDQEQIDWIRQNRGIEQHRVDNMVKPYIDMPVFGAIIQGQNGEEYLITIDGHHRIVKLFEQGTCKIPGVIFRKPVWEKCLVIPPKHLRAALPEFSGITYDERK